MSEALRYRLDDLRRLSTSLGAALGLAPARSAALSAQLLWYDAAGAQSQGICTLPDWLQRLESHEFDPAAEGRVTTERAGTAVLDGQNGVPLLLLERAGALAVEKARDTGIGLVRLANVGRAGSVACVVAEMALGPIAALAIGPGKAAAVALPSDQGLPAVYDSILGSAAAEVADAVFPLAQALLPDGGWLIAALSIAALEPISTFHERVAAVAARAEAMGIRSGFLCPQAWEVCRRDAREQGVAVEKSVWHRLKGWADRHAITLPEPYALPR